MVWSRRLAHALSSRSSSIDVLHLHGGAAGALRVSRLRKRGIPSVVNPHGMESFGAFSLLRVPNRVFFRRLLRSGALADVVIATDASMRSAVESNIGVDPARIHVVPNSVDTSYLRQLGDGDVDSGQFTIVSVGRVAYNKGYDLLAAALGDPSLKSELPSDYIWLHFGSGSVSEERSLMATARRSEVPLLILRGKSDREVQRALANCDLFVQPSRFEGSSLTTLEAMAHGRVIVASAVGGIPDKIEDGVTGILIDVPEVPSVIRALLRALEADSPSVGASAMASVEERFSESATAKSYEALYASFVTTWA